MLYVVMETDNVVSLCSMSTSLKAMSRKHDRYLATCASRSIFSDWLEDARWARIWFSLQPKERRREPQRMNTIRFEI